MALHNGALDTSNSGWPLSETSLSMSNKTFPQDHPRLPPRNHRGENSKEIFEQALVVLAFSPSRTFTFDISYMIPP